MILNLDDNSSTIKNRNISIVSFDSKKSKSFKIKMFAVYELSSKIKKYWIIRGKINIILIFPNFFSIEKQN